MKISGIIRLAASVLLVHAAAVSCQKNEPVKSNSLEVTPSDAIQFKATGNTPVELTVTTDAESWEFTAPDWIEAVREADVLSVNASDNTTEGSRTGRITITAGTAEKVNIFVSQDSPEGGLEPGKVKAGIVDVASDGNEVSKTVTTAEPVYSSKIRLVLEQPASEDMEIKVSLDMEYGPEYSFTHDNIKCEMLPEDKVTLGSECILSLKAGQTESEPVDVAIDLSGQQNLTSYLVSVKIDETTVPDGISFPASSKRVNYLLRKKLYKEVRNVVYLEVNNTNPLNLLEYKLEDGSPFFDVVILFAANINYNAGSDMVYLFKNPNVLALLNEGDVYLQPLRDAGIEVHLGLLPNHTPAGLCNLSEAGAEMFASNVANDCKLYNIDGVNLDEEYVQGTSESYLFTDKPGASTYLCYQLKKQFREICGRDDMQVSVFDFRYDWNNYTADDGTVYRPVDYIDFYVGNYELPTYPENGFTIRSCSGLSIECNKKLGSIDEAGARRIKESGYGWMMWFAFHPQTGGGLDNNASRIDPMIKAAARGFYDQELVEPTGYYRKPGAGMFDPQRYNR